MTHLYPRALQPRNPHPTQHSLSCLPGILIFLISVLSCTGVSAASLLSFDFESADGAFETTADAHLAGINVGSWLDSNGSLRDFAGVEGRAAGARDWLDGNSFRLLFAIHPGYTLNLQRIEFHQRASASGPSQWTASILDNVIGQGLTSTSFQDASFDTPELALQGLVSFVLTGTGASSNSGTWRIDDFAIFGELTAVPVPGAAPMFVLALVACRRLAGRR